ncbi:TetR/AcrR family transcriptional regulator [Actinomadura atramentaria]|uniref:TetR/AcrR family transcriptional regulator n=1 Tax=Actinomadura atramentaria TaxID=1990 RepID=UPI000363B7A7|nr:TetR/AcrR family transcriptional regulator [Actinomadura atramentaria]
MRPRTKPTEERRADLLDAAEAIAVERGVDALTVDQVTARAGVSKGTFYLYFKSKDEVLEGLRDRYVAGFLVRQDAAVARAAPGDHLARVQEWVTSALVDYVEDHRLHDVVFQHRPPVEDAGEHLPVAAVARLLDEGVAAGAFALPDPAATAIVLYSAVHGAADHLIHSGERTAPDRVVREIRRLCRALLVPDSA